MRAARAMRLPLLVAAAQAITAPVDYVNLLAGSFTRGDVFSTGNTLPLVGRPWGFNHWALQTNDGRSAWWFNGNDHEFKWIRCTHQPSPWIGDYGWFMVGPQMGDLLLLQQVSSSRERLRSYLMCWTSGRLLMG